MSLSFVYSPQNELTDYSRTKKIITLISIVYLNLILKMFKIIGLELLPWFNSVNKY